MLDSSVVLPFFHLHTWAVNSEAGALSVSRCSPLAWVVSSAYPSLWSPKKIEIRVLCALGDRCCLRDERTWDITSAQSRGFQAVVRSWRKKVPEEENWYLTPSVATSKGWRGRPIWEFFLVPHSPALCLWECLYLLPPYVLDLQNGDDAQTLGLLWKSNETASKALSTWRRSNYWVKASSWWVLCCWHLRTSPFSWLLSVVTNWQTVSPGPDWSLMWMALTPKTASQMLSDLSMKLLA